MLTDSAILAPGALDARARNLRGEPHTHAHFKAESPQHVYTVRFDSQEL
jgi:hypothetical protein